MASKGRTTTRNQKEEIEDKVTLGGIKKIFQEMFQAHEKTIVDILAANNKIINERMDNLTKHLEEVEKSLEF